MKQTKVILSNSKLWHIIKEIMATINAGKKPAFEIYRSNEFSTNFNTSYFDLIARSNSIR